MEVGLGFLVYFIGTDVRGGTAGADATQHAAGGPADAGAEGLLSEVDSDGEEGRRLFA